MKKIIIFIVFIGLIVGGYFIFKKLSQEQTPRCEEGYRFVPSTQTCELITSEELTLDFTKIQVQIPDTLQLMTLQKEAQEGQYSVSYKTSSSSDVEGFVSLKQSDVVYYSENLILVPIIINSGGTGNFVYVGLFDIKINKHLDSVFIGDRVGIDTLEIKNNTARVLFKKRLNSESFAATPTIPTEIVLEVKDNSLVELVRIENARFEDIELKSLPIVSKNQMLDIRGAIPGTWYFEATAHYRIFDNEYNEIALGSVQALSDWMTTQRVPFEIKISTSNMNYTGTSTLVIESPNMQGDEEGERLVKRVFIPLTI